MNLIQHETRIINFLHRTIHEIKKKNPWIWFGTNASGDNKKDLLMLNPFFLQKLYILKQVYFEKWYLYKSFMEYEWTKIWIVRHRMKIRAIRVSRI